ncbi:phasin family protein [Methylopila turkensis]|uniref:Phasin family protein n=1 Tax=Methylopila turkensis TaxID=1437816 RepID=A0A9W6JNB6_9HYPH|nr:phasin family protein [Methylopila turkensis]GLK80790.1 phasin family protein [Methylopila turkensis]
MTATFEDAQKYSKENVDLALKSFGTMSKGFQAIAVEVADYSKKSFEDSAAHVEKLLGVKSFDKAIEAQSAFAKSAYEAYIAKMTKLGELYADIAKESYKPVETAFAKVK